MNGTMTSQRYRDKILSPVVLQYLPTNGPGLTFQKDNAIAHTAKQQELYGIKTTWIF